MDKYCIGCAHYRAEHTTNLMCNYIFDTDHMRPCPPGRGCSVFLPRQGVVKNNTEKLGTCPQKKEKIV